MNTRKISKLKKLAIYTSIIIGSSFFVVACDNNESTSSTVAQKPQAMSPQEQSDFIKNVMTNFITNYNSTQYIVTASIASFTPTQDLQQISMDVIIAPFNAEDDNSNIIKTTYLITPEQELQDNAYTVAKFVSQSISYVSNDNDSTDVSINKFIEESGLLSDGYVMASGDIINNVKSVNDFNYVNAEARWRELGESNIAAFNYHAKTKNEMKLIDYNYQFPLISFKSDDVVMSVKNVNIKGVNKSFDKNFNYTGDDLYKLDSFNIKNDDGNEVTLNNIIWESKTEITNNNLINSSGKTSFTGNFLDDEKGNIDFSFSANINVNNLNLQAIQNLNQFITDTNTDVSNQQQMEYVLEIIKNGASFSMTDSHIKLNDAEGFINLSVGIDPLPSSSNTSISVMGMQMLNSITINMDSQIPVQWLSILSGNENRALYDVMINQSIQQVEKMGYNGALTYDGKIITAKFEVKKGNVFVNGELKGPLVNALVGAMH